ncbi:MAG: aspartate/glutamate racemase family protein [Opitutus sp.]
MKTIGLIGGLSWVSTAAYYRIINEEIRHRTGGYHSASMVLKSLDFDPLVECETPGQWKRAAELLAQAGQAVERAGAGCVLICANAFHKVAPEIETAVKIPLLHIADVTAASIRRAKMSRVGLLGTRTTMEQPFLIERIVEGHPVDVIVPKSVERERVHRIIFEELCRGEIRDESRILLTRLVEQFRREGARGVILACTELSLLFHQEDSVLPVFDTTELHGMAAVEWSLQAPEITADSRPSDFSAELTRTPAINVRDHKHR